MNAMSKKNSTIAQYKCVVVPLDTKCGELDMTISKTFNSIFLAGLSKEMRCMWSVQHKYDTII